MTDELTLSGLLTSADPLEHGAKVEIEGLKKSYDGTGWAVEDLDLVIEPGEFVTILGPSGSGKTTALMMLAGFETPTAGTIRLNGTAVDRLPAYKRNIGMVFQSYALFPNMSIEDNIAYPLKIRKIPKADRKRLVDASLELVQLQQHRRKRPNQLSGGQQQRVALARATVFAPGLLLMDEPLGALDRKLRQTMQNEIAKIHRTLGVSVVSVTHDQEEALSLSDRVLIMAEGRMQQLGTPSEIYERPANAFVADFIGEANVLDVTNGRLAESAIRTVGSDPTAQLRGSTQASVRPEMFFLEADDAGAGIVENVTYCGSTVRYEVLLPSGERVVARRQAGPEITQFSRGDRISVNVAGDALVALAD
ncbi:MAG: ABC transporter ATP-binding protein [Mycobacterium sp.]